MSEGRILLNFQKVEASPVLDRAATERAVTDALRRSESKLHAMSQRFGRDGWVIDTDYGRDGYEFGLKDHTVIGRLRLVRPA